MRRGFDIICAAAGVLLLFPLLTIVAIAVKLEDGGPVFYFHKRVGRNFHKFGLMKFRTMVPGADRRGGPLTVAGDSRVTRVGSFLRKHKLDELPQLINVLKGDMQLVGARPEVERYVEMFRAQFAAILRDRPGITDPASFAYRNEGQIFARGDVEQQYVSQILPHKLKLSLHYQNHRNFRSDLGMVFRTLCGISRVEWRSQNPPSTHRVPDADATDWRGQL